MTISENIKKARESKGLSQEEAAQKAGIVLSTYRTYEQGRQYPPADKLKNIAVALGASADRLLFGDENNEIGKDIQLLVKMLDHLPQHLKKNAWIALRGVVMSFETEMLETLRNQEKAA